MRFGTFLYGCFDFFHGCILPTCIQLLADFLRGCGARANSFRAAMLEGSGTAGFVSTHTFSSQTELRQLKFKRGNSLETALFMENLLEHFDKKYGRAKDKHSCYRQSE
jgi:hypothetical protein